MKKPHLVVLLLVLCSFSFQSDFGSLVQRRKAIEPRYETARSLPSSDELLARHYRDMVRYCLASFDEDTATARFYETLDRKGQLPKGQGEPLISRMGESLDDAEAYTDSLQIIANVKKK